eukprot:1141233-Pelagomonas_calceolata.AAC.3
MHVQAQSRFLGSLEPHNMLPFSKACRNKGFTYVRAVVRVRVRATSISAHASAQCCTHGVSQKRDLSKCAHLREGLPKEGRPGKGRYHSKLLSPPSYLRHTHMHAKKDT